MCFEGTGRHTRTAITVTVEAEPNAVILTVADDGHGAALTGRERIVERRFDDARSRDEGGVGLVLLASTAKSWTSTGLPLSVCWAGSRQRLPRVVVVPRWSGLGAPHPRNLETVHARLAPTCPPCRSRCRVDDRPRRLRRWLR
ncbi:ATP-binding protein [Streptomyces sp. SAS_269]|uniref:ATP-binding protein n=1 Tax=Streptomyces sp. SAS_269 TaxID=3412749 RepID=UPI00403CD77A